MYLAIAITLRCSAAAKHQVGTAPASAPLQCKQQLEAQKGFKILYFSSPAVFGISASESKTSTEVAESNLWEEAQVVGTSDSYDTKKYKNLTQTSLLVRLSCQKCSLTEKCIDKGPEMHICI